MAWKTITPATAGTSAQFGGNDTNKISNLFNAVLDVDTVDINSSFTLRDQKFKLRNPGNTFSYKFTTSAIVADRLITVPLLAADDTLVLANFAQTLQNKTIDAASNSLTGIVDTNIGTHTTSKISTTSKSLLNSAIVYNDQSNTFPSSNQSFPSGFLLVKNPSGTFSYFVNAGAITANRNITLPLLTADDTIDCIANTATLTNKTITASSNTITDTSAATGDLFYYNGTRYVRFAKGSANQQLAVSADGTTITWINSGTGSSITGSTIDAELNTVPHFDTMSSAHKTGKWAGTDDTNGAAGMFQAFLTASGSNNSVRQLDSSGLYTTFGTGSSSGNTAAIQPDGLHCMRSFNPRIKARFRIGNTSSCRVFIGMSDDADAHDPNGSSFLNSKTGAMLMFGNGIGNGSNFYIGHNSGGGTATLDNTNQSASSGTVYTVELILNDASANLKWAINNGSLSTISSNIPASSTSMGVSWGIETTTGSERDLDMFYVDWWQDK
jgi:hypothetical protein